jgi:hypothetical protein
MTTVYCNKDSCDWYSDGNCNRGSLMLKDGACQNYAEKYPRYYNENGEEELPFIPKPIISKH